MHTMAAWCNLDNKNLFSELKNEPLPVPPALGFGRCSQPSLRWVRSAQPSSTGRTHLGFRSCQLRVNDGLLLPRWFRQLFPERCRIGTSYRWGQKSDQMLGLLFNFRHQFLLDRCRIGTYNFETLGQCIRNACLNICPL